MNLSKTVPSTKTQKLPSITPPYFWWGVLLITIVGAILRLWALGRASLWLDEILTQTRMDVSFFDSIELILDSSNQTPFYFVLNYLWPNGSAAALRMPAALMGIIGIPLLMVVIARLYERYDWALLAGALLAVNPYHVWLSRNARPYPLVFILTLLISYFFLRLLAGERTRANWIAFTLSCMAGYMTHYYMLGLPLAQYVFFAFILRGQRGFFRRWFRAQIVAGIPLVLWIVALWLRGSVSVGIGWIPTPGVREPFLTIWNLTVGYDGSAPWYSLPGLAVALVGFVVGLVAAARSLKRNRTDFYWFWTVIAPFAAVFAVSLFNPLYVDRYFVIILPAVLIFMIEGWSRLPRRSWVLVPALLVMAAGVISIIDTLDQRVDEKENWRSAGAYVKSMLEPGDGLLAESPFELIAMKHYMDDELPPYAWLLDNDPLAEQYEEPITRIWAIYRNPSEDGHRQGVLDDFDPFAETESPMDDWLRENRDAVRTDEIREFNGVTVLLVDLSVEPVEPAIDTEETN